MGEETSVNMQRVEFHDAIHHHILKVLQNILSVLHIWFNVDVPGEGEFAYLLVNFHDQRMGRWISR